MSAQVIQLASVNQVDDAWNQYIEFARVLMEDHTKLCDRTFQEEFARRFERWRKLFTMQDAER